jgi:D-galactose 1-dehydrogenase
MTAIRIALVGIGKIARDQHMPALAANRDFALAAAVSRSGGIEGLPAFHSLDELAASSLEIDAVSLCTPPVGRYAQARQALEQGWHVMLEKPPGATVAEVEQLSALASSRGVALFATWHSREAPAVDAARQWLAAKRIEAVRIDWKEDVRRWHPGQQWIWEPGGLGVFDPGINALSIATRILPTALILQEAELAFPSNRGTPIAARLRFTHEAASVEAEFDWRQTGPQSWNIAIDTGRATLVLSEGGAAMAIDGVEQLREEPREYPRLYERFAALVRDRSVDADLIPLRHVADAFMIGRRLSVEPFLD